VSRTATLAIANTAGTVSTTAGNAVDQYYGSYMIRCKGGNAIVTKTVGTFTGTTYDFYSAITQMN
jgi:hypothetical protein